MDEVHPTLVQRQRNNLSPGAAPTVFWVWCVLGEHHGAHKPSAACEHWQEKYVAKKESGESTFPREGIPNFIFVFFFFPPKKEQILALIVACTALYTYLSSPASVSNPPKPLYLFRKHYLSNNLLQLSWYTYHSIKNRTLLDNKIHDSLPSVHKTVVYEHTTFVNLGILLPPCFRL